VGTERHAPHGARVAAQSQNFLTGLHVPKFDGRIRASRGEATAVGAKGHAPHRPRMAVQVEQRLTALHVPDFQLGSGQTGGVPTARSQESAIRAEGDAIDRNDVVDGESLLAGLNVPERTRDITLRPGWDRPDCGKALAIATVCDTVGGITQAVECADL